jgi:hypothetical protein
MTPERAVRNHFDVGVMVAIGGLTLTLLGIAVKGGELAGDLNARLRSLEQQIATSPLPVEITPGAAREISALKARQDMDDKYRSELDARLVRIEQTQFEILRELRKR